VATLCLLRWTSSLSPSASLHVQRIVLLRYCIPASPFTPTIKELLNQHKDVELGGFLAGTGLIIPTSCTKTLQIEDHQASGLGVASADMAEVFRGI